ncbi:uncharacterized protein [Anabrus simplex]|uniref:uncharacterized protein n=1 Tax=Anabrus simplex TaxID=316456 RepID=UPI0034DD3123
MKTTLVTVLLTFFACVMAEPDLSAYQEKIEKYLDICQEFLGASDDDIQVVKNAQNLETATQQCLQYCISHLQGNQNKLGYNNIQLAIQNYKFITRDRPDLVENAEANVKECIAEANAANTTDTCKYAKIIQECVRRQSDLL